MPTWDTLRNKAVAGLSNVAQEGSRQARLAKLRLQLADVNGRHQDALRELGEAVFKAKEAGTPLGDIAATLQPIWDKLATLTQKHEELQAAIDGELPADEAPSAQVAAPSEAAPPAAGRFCAQCGGAVGPQARFCAACGTAVSV